MWKIVCNMLRGKSHIEDNLPCQDYICSKDGKGVICIALADGAGSCQYSDLGAKFACNTTCDLFIKDFDFLYESGENYIRQTLIHRIRTRLGIWAKRKQTSKDAFASTLLFFAIKDTRAIIGHIGDGVIGAISNGNLSVVSKPENGEYVNTTFFTTSSSKHLRLALVDIPNSLETIFLMSDGAAELLYGKQNNTLAPALSIMASWIDLHDIESVEKSLDLNMKTLFLSKTTDDCSIIFLHRDKDV